MVTSTASRASRWSTLARLGVVAVTVAVLVGAVIAGAGPQFPSLLSDEDDDGVDGVPRGPAGTIPLEDADARFTGERSGDRAGWSVESAGDVNGDGVDDVLVAAPRSDRGGQNAGAVYLFYRRGRASASGLAPEGEARH